MRALVAINYILDTVYIVAYNAKTLPRNVLAGGKFGIAVT